MNRLRVPEVIVERVELPSGLVAILAENRSVPSLTINAVVRAGERYVPDELAGIGRLTGTLLAHGTTRQTAQGIAEAVETVGGRLRTRGGYATSHIELTLLSEDVEQGLSIVAELLREPMFPEERVGLVIDRSLGELCAQEDDSRWVASTAFNEVIFEGTPQHRPAEGYARTISALTRKDFVAFHESYFTPQNTLVVIAGDFDAGVIRDSLSSVFGSWEASRNLGFPEVRLPQRQTRGLRRVVTRDKEQASVMLGHLGIARSSPDYFRIRVLDTILGDSPGFTSRVPRVLRDERGLAYSVHCDMARSAGLDPGRFVAYIGTAPESVSDAIEGLREQIQLITTQPPSESEVAAAKAYLTGSFVFEFESNALVASYLANTELFSLGEDYPRRFLAEVEKVTPEDVFEVARTYLNPEAMTEVIVGPVLEDGSP